jgi:hypothetical protein
MVDWLAGLFAMRRAVQASRERRRLAPGDAQMAGLSSHLLRDVGLGARLAAEGGEMPMVERRGAPAARAGRVLPLVL